MSSLLSCLMTSSRFTQCSINAAHVSLLKQCSPPSMYSTLATGGRWRKSPEQITCSPPKYVSVPLITEQTMKLSNYSCADHGHFIKHKYISVPGNSSPLLKPFIVHDKPGEFVSCVPPSFQTPPSVNSLGSVVCRWELQTCNPSRTRY